MDNNKLNASAHQLGVMLGIPMYVDPDKGFEAEKILTWENGDKIKVTVIWADGAFYYTAYLGQIDPKTNEMSFITGKIAEANSLESLIGMVDGFLKDKALERGIASDAVTPEVTVPVDAEAPEEPAVVELPVDAEVPADDTPVEVLSVPELIADYQSKFNDYHNILLDPVHDHELVKNMSKELVSLENRLRENGIRLSDIKD